MSRNIKLTIQYDGTNFYGWQVQPNKRTVQGEIESALIKIFKQEIRLYGSGRTDTGVHAIAQVANFHTTSHISLDKIKKAINNNIESDVIISSIMEVDKEFHSQYSAKVKTYRYRIYNADELPPLDRYYTLLFPYKLNLNLMRKGAKYLFGTHDFKSFQGNNKSNKDQDTIRTIKKISITKKDNLICIDITANGFLYKMVRNIVGLLLSVGTGQTEECRVKSILKAKSRGASPKTAPAHGLTLCEVKY